MLTFEHCNGDEKRGASFPMNDNHNAYRAYVEYLIKIWNPRNRVKCVICYYSLDFAF